jgi:hypothetical protein
MGCKSMLWKDLLARTGGVVAAPKDEEGTGKVVKNKLLTTNV